MARQEVNLYTQEFRQGQQPLSARRIVQYAGAVFVLLLLVEAFTAWRLIINKERLQKAENTLIATEARVTALKQNRPLSQRAKLEADVARLDEQVQRREELRTILSGQNLGNAAGFSSQLQAMARQTVDDVALSEIRLLQGGAYVEFGGETMQAESVPQYLQNLREEESFENVRFGVLSILREKESDQRLQFTIGKSTIGKSTIEKSTVGKNQGNQR